MLGTLTAGIVVTLLANQLFARLVQTKTGFVWPHLDIRFSYWGNRGEPQPHHPSGRRASDRVVASELASAAVAAESPPQTLWAAAPNPRRGEGYGESMFTGSRLAVADPLAAAALARRREAIVQRVFQLPPEDSDDFAFHSDDVGAISVVDTTELDQSSLAVETPRSGSRPSQRWQVFQITAIEDESPDCRSYRLVPQGDEPLPPYRGGQSVAVRLLDRRTGQTLVRCYSLSGVPGEPHYQITVKRVPGGRMSNMLHNRMRVGDTLELQTPRGHFCVPTEHPNRPLVLIAGGIGITPLLAMLFENLEQNPQRPVDLYYQLRSPDHAPFLTLLRETLAQLPEHAPTRLHLFYSQPGEGLTEPGVTIGRLSAASVLATAAGAYTTERWYMICGPEQFNHQLTADLVTAGVPRGQVQYEAFGCDNTMIDAVRSVAPAKGSHQPPRKVASQPTKAETTTPASAPTIHFAASNQTATWDPQCNNLLELAETNDLPLESSCRSGVCGACVLKRNKGTVEYHRPPGCDPADDEVVMCIARPTSDLSIDG